MTGPRTGTVYTLADPRNGLIRYVGATTAPIAVRLSGHLNTARRDGIESAVAVWVRELLAVGCKPAITPLHTVPESELPTVERQEIERHHDAGWPLTNCTNNPGAPRAWDSTRKLAAARRRAERLADIGGHLLTETMEEIGRLEARLERYRDEVDAEAAEMRAYLDARNPTEESRFEAAIRLLLDEWNAEPIGFRGWPPLDQDDLDCLTSILLDLAVTGSRRGVPFSHVVSGVGRPMLRDMRMGNIARRSEPDTAA